MGIDYVYERTEDIKYQELFLAICLQEPDKAEDFLRSNLTREHFAPAHAVVADAILWAQSHGVHLTYKTFMEYITPIIDKKIERAQLDRVYGLIATLVPVPDD